MCSLFKDFEAGARCVYHGGRVGSSGADTVNFRSPCTSGDKSEPHRSTWLLLGVFFAPLIEVTLLCTHALRLIHLFLIVQAGFNCLVCSSGWRLFNWTCDSPRITQTRLK